MSKDFCVERGGGPKEAAGGFARKTSTPRQELFPWLVVWYGASVSYGMMTKSLLKEVYYPWTVATVQMLSGLLFQLPLWYLNLHDRPSLTWQDVKALVPVAICQLGVHVGATMATGMNDGLPIAHVVKALEPIVTLAIDYILLGRSVPVDTLLGLVPLVAGVVLPYWTAKKFSAGATVAAIVVVVCSSTRVVLIHKILADRKIGKNLDAKNLFAVLSIMTSLILVPITLQYDGFGLFHALTERASVGSMSQVTANLCISGYLYYLFNEASFTLMERMAPTTHAVANLMRRPVVTLFFVASNIFHRFCDMVSVKLIPLSFLIWDQAFRETHTVADILRRQGEASLMTRFAQPSIDSLVGSFLGFAGCIIYLKETADGDGGDSEVRAQQKTGSWKKKKDQRRLGVPQ